jgi:thiamine-monophosphate kinase
MIEEKNSRTELSELGEFGLIARLTHEFSNQQHSTVKGMGDDAAVFKNDGMLNLITNDLLVEGVHFDLTYTPLKHLGYKAAVVNFSDIYAMNGTPTQMVIGIAVSNRFSVEALEEFYAGIRMACNKYNVDLVGGDTTSSKSGLFISITVIGKVSEEKIAYRNTAFENDLICVSGDLGGAYAGLMLLEREKSVFLANPDMQPDLEGYDYIIERQLKPEARKDIVSFLEEKGIVPTSMIDISDGLASEIMHICSDSDKGCFIYEEKIPIDITTINFCDSLKIDPTTAALNGGEDYELLFTVAQNDFEKIKDYPDITIIGHIAEKSAGYNLVTRSNQMAPLQAQGWDGLKEKNIL